MGTIGISINQAQTAVPLFLTLTRAGAGGITGKSPTVALRDGSTLDSYLDFNDSTFKTVGWTTKYETLDEIERGHYQKSIDISALGLSANDVLVAEYHVDDSGDVVGDAADLLLIAEFEGNLKIVRQSVTNRMETIAGSPGLLKLYDDAGINVIATWTLKDSADGGIIATVGTPAKRGAKTP